MFSRCRYFRQRSSFLEDKMTVARKIYISCTFIFSCLSILLSVNVYSGQITAMYGINDGEDYFPLCIEKSPDDGLIICGATYTRNAISINDADILVIRVNAEGAILWKKQFGGNSEEMAYGITATYDGAYIIAAWSNDFDALGYVKSWLIKISDNGTILWQKAYGERTFARKAYELPDHNIIVVGGIYEGAGTNLLILGWIMKIDPNGNVIWTKTAINEDIQLFEFIGATLVGDSEFIAWGMDRLYKFNTDGMLIWKKAITEAIGEIKSLALTTSGDYLIAAHDPLSDNEGHPEILCYANDGSFRWAKELPVNDDGYDNDVLLGPLFPKGDGIVTAFAQFIGYTATDANFYSGEGVIEINETGQCEETAIVYKKSLGSVTFSSKSAVIAPDGNVAFCTGIWRTDDVYGEKMKYGLLKTSGGNIISGNCVETIEIPLLWQNSGRSSLCEVTDQTNNMDIAAVDTTPYNYVYESSVKGITTFCPLITQVNKLQNPFRLEILGDNYGTHGYLGNSMQVTISGIPVPSTTFKGPQRIIAKKGTALKNLLPKGVPVCIQVRAVNSNGNELPLYKSDCFTFTR